MSNTLKFAAPRLVLHTQAGCFALSLPLSYHIKRVVDGRYESPDAHEMLDFAVDGCAMGGSGMRYLVAEDGSIVPLHSIILVTCNQAACAKDDFPCRMVMVVNPTYASDGSIMGYSEARYDGDAPYPIK